MDALRKALGTLKVHDKALEQLMDKFQSGSALAAAENVQCSETLEQIFDLAQLEEDRREALKKLQEEINGSKAERKSLIIQVHEEGETLRTIIDEVANHQRYLEQGCSDRQVPHTAAVQRGRKAF